MQIIFLGRDSDWATRALDGGFEVYAKGLSDADNTKLEARGCTITTDLMALWPIIDGPRTYLIDADTGSAVDQLIDTDYVCMEPGDLVLDPTSSYWGDTLRRYRRMRHRALYYLDLALLETQNGATLLASGEVRGRTLAAPILEKLSAAATLTMLGDPGSAHFAASLHDAVNIARAQAMSEVSQLIEAFPQPLDQAATQSVMEQATGIAAGRQSWLLDDAFNLEAPVPLLLQASLLQMTEALDAHRSEPPLPRVGGFVDPDEIL